MAGYVKEKAKGSYAKPKQEKKAVIKIKKMRKDAMQLAGSSIFMGVGSTVITRTGGNAAVMGNMSRFLPIHGTLSGAKATFKLLKKLK